MTVCLVSLYCIQPGVRKFGKRLESGFSSAAGIKSACRTYGTLTLGSGWDMHINERPTNAQLASTCALFHSVLFK